MSFSESNLKAHIKSKVAGDTRLLRPSLLGCVKQKLLILTSALLVAGIQTGCVYFNTYYNAQKYFRQAERARKQIEDQHQNLSDSRRAKGLGLQNRGQRRPQGSKNPNHLYDQAARKASIVLEKYRDSDLVDDAMFLLGRSFYWQGHYRDAARSFRDLEINFPDSEFFIEAQYWRGLSFEAQGVFSEARSIYRSLFRTADAEIASLAGLRLGEIAFQEKEYVSAIQEYQTTLEQFQKSDTRAELWLRLGEAMFALGDTSLLHDASVSFEQVLRESPADKIEYRARLEHGRLLYRMGNVDEARVMYSDLLQDGRFRFFEGQTRLLIGQYLEDQGLPQEALTEFMKVRDDFPQTEASAMAIYRTGLLYLSHYSDRNRAQDYLQAVLEENSSSEAAKLSKQTLDDLNEIDTMLHKIRLADSLHVSDGTLSSNGQDSILTEQGSSRVPLAVEAISQQDRDDPREKLDETLLAVAEMYRDRLVMPDSAIYFYNNFVERFPESHQVPRALYNIAWIHSDMLKGGNTAFPVLQLLVDEHPRTDHANAARELLGYPPIVTAEHQAIEEYDRIEKVRLANINLVDRYLPKLDALIGAYPLTETGARAMWLTAWTYENIVGDTLEAEARYNRIKEEFPGTELFGLVVEREKARAEGLLDKLERELKSVGAGERPGEKLVTIAVEPDTADSVLLARKHLGFALRAHRRGELKIAKDFYELCLEQQARSPMALFGLGEIAWEDAYFDDAVDYFNEVLAFDRTMIGPYYRLFAMHTQAGREDSSNHYLREILRKDGENPEIRDVRDQFRVQWGPEPEDLDISTLQEIELVPPPTEVLFAVPKSLLPFQEGPTVRKSKLPSIPENTEYDSAKVIVDILVSDEGKAAVVEIFRGKQDLESAALQAAREYLFYPAVDNKDQKIAVWVEVEIPFIKTSKQEQSTSLSSKGAEEFTKSPKPGANIIMSENYNKVVRPQMSKPEMSPTEVDIRKQTIDEGGK